MSMADKSISQKVFEINYQFKLIDNLSDYVEELQALAEIGINCNFDCVSEDSIKSYCYSLLSLAISAKKNTDELLEGFRNSQN